MPDPADTRESLLVRLGDPSCDDAWREFSVIYRPMIFRLARRSGLQHEDAEDVSQRVLVSVMEAIAGWQKDPAKGRFRGWLTTITKNAIRNDISRAPRDQASGNSELRILIEQASDSTSELDELIEAEYMRSVFREAARRVRMEFEDSTWMAFWMTSVDGLSVSETGRRLKMTSGAIYAARSRIMRRLQVVALELSEEE